MKYDKHVALIYDFDNTLALGNMQEFEFIPSCNMTTLEFWDMVGAFAKENNMDATLAYMFIIVEMAKKKNISITKKDLMKQGASITFFDGVKEWFQKINQLAKSLNLTCDHYIISCGQKEVLEGTEIAKEFKRIFASSFCFDENSVPIWPAHAINYTTKTQYIYRIRKQKLDNLYNSSEVNEYIKQRETLFPYQNMVYFGDGETDIPCMKKIKTSGGTSICVYDESDGVKKEVAQKLLSEDRVNYIFPSSYKEGGALYNKVKEILVKIAQK